MSAFTLRRSPALGRLGAGVALLMGAALLATLPVAPAHAAVGSAVAAVQAVPGHTRLVPDTPRANTPNIPNGEIWDMEVVGNRVFIAGSFTSIKNTTGNGTSYNQRSLASYNLDTGLVDASFRPTFDGAVTAVEASPDGTKLFVAGTFNTVGGVSERKVASINLTTGAAVTSFNFTGNTNNQATALAVTNSTVYVGGRFTKINNVSKSGLAAVNAATGVVDPAFTNDIEGGVGLNGVLTVQQLKLTHDETKLLVVHTGRRINGQDRYGAALIDTATKQLLPWHTHLWEDNLQYVGGVQRAYNADMAPNDQFFVVTSGSGGDRPPINDTAMAFPVAGGDDVQPLWVSRHFDSVYSVAITEKAVYVGGHFSFEESPTAPDPWPGLDDVGYGTGQGLAGYSLGDSVVRRNHIGALDPATGKALEWNPGSNSFEGNKAMEATARGLFVGGDGKKQGGVTTGRVAFYDLNTVAAPTLPDTTITNPIEGRVASSGQQFVVDGTATTAANTGVRRVQVTVQDIGSKQYLKADGSWSSGAYNFTAGLATPNASSTAWSLPVTLTGTRVVNIKAKTQALTNATDATPAVKKIESYNFDDKTPTTTITSPSGILASTDFQATGTASDDHGVSAISFWFRDSNGQYLQSDGSMANELHTFRGLPDVVGATSATWRYDVSLPHEGTWKISATAIDTAGQSALDNANREFLINSAAQAPTVSITAPVTMIPPTATQPVLLAPGSPITFSGNALDEKDLANVEVQLRNSTTRETLGADGTWSVDNIGGWYRVTPGTLTGTSTNWSWTTPFNLRPGTYTFSVRATDDDGLSTGSSNQGRLTLNVQVPGDLPPNGLLNVTGTISGVTVRHLDLAGTATDDFGVDHLLVTVRENESGRYLQPNGTLSALFATRTATLASPLATSTTWTLPVDLPSNGDYSITAFAYDTVGQQDTSTSGATARYLVFPGDALPYLVDGLGQPINGAAFTESRIVVSGRAQDDTGMQDVQIGIVDSLGRYMSSSGTFTSTTASWRSAFLTSPGSAGSNFSYTTPVIPDGTYTVLVRAVDVHSQVQAVPSSVIVTVTSPPGNLPPVPQATVACVNNNVCTFDGRTSTDENAPTLTYSWNFGNGRTASGPLPTLYYTGPGTFTPTLTVRDEYGLSATLTLAPLTITEPPDNVAPSALINQPACNLLACNFSGVGSADPNPSDTIRYLWSFGDGTATSTSTSPAHTFLAAGTYTVTLTVTDGWGRFTTTTRTITVSAV